MKSEWEKIKDFENYSIDCKGNVRNDFTGNLKITQLNNKGYLVVHLWKHNKRTVKLIHRLLAESFLDNPDNLPDVNHLDGVKTNNELSNLEWVTHKKNMEHALDEGLFYSKLSVENVKDIKRMRLVEGHTMSSIAKKYGVTLQNISMICRGKSWWRVRIDDWCGVKG